MSGLHQRLKAGYANSYECMGTEDPCRGSGEAIGDYGVMRTAFYRIYAIDYPICCVSIRCVDCFNFYASRTLTELSALFLLAVSSASTMRRM